MAWVGARSLLTGQNPTAPMSGTLPAPMNAMRSNLAMVCGGSLLACWGVSWAIGRLVCDLRGPESWRPKRALWWISLAMFAATALLFFPPWQLFGALFWLAGSLMLLTLLCVRPGTWSALIPAALFGLYIEIGIGASPPWFGVPVSLVFALVAFGHLLILRRPGWVDWDKWSLPHREPQA